MSIKYTYISILTFWLRDLAQCRRRPPRPPSAPRSNSERTGGGAETARRRLRCAQRGRSVVSTGPASHGRRDRLSAQASREGPARLRLRDLYRSGHGRASLREAPKEAPLDHQRRIQTLQGTPPLGRPQLDLEWHLEASELRSDAPQRPRAPEGAARARHALEAQGQFQAIQS